MTDEEFEERQQRRKERFLNEICAYSEDQAKQIMLQHSLENPEWQVPNIGNVLKKLNYDAWKQLRVIDSEAERWVRANVACQNLGQNVTLF